MMPILQYSLMFLMLFICGCVHFQEHEEKNISDFEAEAIKMLLIDDANNFYARSGTEYVIFISSGFKGWDGNITPMPHHFSPAPKQWIKKLSIPNADVKNVTESIGVRDGAALLVADKKTGVKGCIFRLEKITTVSSNEVHIKAEFYCGAMQSVRGTWILVHNNSGWSVVDIKDVRIQ